MNPVIATKNFGPPGPPIGARLSVLIHGMKFHAESRMNPERG